MDLSLPHILLLLLIVLILFGGKRIPEMMRGLGQGIREFKEGMRTDEHTTPNPPPPPAAPSQPTQEKK
jgi:sec-independent protein translocase protein TatA